MTTQAQVVTTQAQVDFTRINSPLFFGSKVNEDPQDFLDEVNNILYSMGVSSNGRSNLASYQLKDVS